VFGSPAGLPPAGAVLPCGLPPAGVVQPCDSSAQATLRRAQATGSSAARTVSQAIRVPRPSSAAHRPRMGSAAPRARTGSATHRPRTGSAAPRALTSSDHSQGPALLGERPQPRPGASAATTGRGPDCFCFFIYRDPIAFPFSFQGSLCKNRTSAWLNPSLSTKQLLGPAGLNPPDPPNTWQNLRSTCIE
jgi:hypothetical protein